MAMAYGCLHSTSLSRILLPVFSRHSNLSTASNRLAVLTSAVNRTGPSPSPVRALAKRGISPKDDEVASASDIEFKAPLKIVEYPDPILRAKNKRIDVFDETLKNLVDEMFDVMYKTDGIGLSAPQVGINVQLMVFNPSGGRGEGDEIVLVNPKINKYSNKLVPFNEGCLSFPGIYADVVRPDSVKIDARDITGARFSISLSRLPARIFQHEFDHLQGILFFDRMSDQVLDGIREELEALEKKYEEKTGLPSPEKIQTRKRKKAGVGFGKR
ncbi:PREDICTED: peptide deformylase 1B, chloroplastic/mitochondrial [Tarenaya hassleriana]|uniref:peptide deformylase 1B, chloroplastic/mitochondrial n=1 Tax=Tarenaya hassleriana TaxID=28532 RepID=UPI00053C4799|nr:PREDICTED: peptide deformylase 1B, chloroplastic/mitochondrial [Tarenaya hassleriana]